MRRAEIERAYSCAYGLLEKYNMHELPIDVEALAANQGAVIAREYFAGSESGFTLRDGKRIIIGVNTRTSRKRQRFTIAHEIGHLILHAGKPLIVDHNVRIDRRDEVSSIGTDNEEIEANAFGAALLMPHGLVNKRVADYVERTVRSGQNISRDELIADLAREFDVSSEAMGFRLINLGTLAA
jgi:Zn-dependent peptidase ImmA (M78 family)